LLSIHRSMGYAWLALGNVPEAMREFEAALTLSVALVAVKQDEPKWQHDLLAVSADLAFARQRHGFDASSALLTFNKALEFARKNAANESSGVSWRLNEAFAQELIAQSKADNDEFGAARAALGEALRIYDELSSQYPDDSALQTRRLYTHENLGNLLMARQQPSAAMLEWQTALQLVTGLLETAPSSAEYRHALSVIHARLGDGRAALNDPVGALDEYRTTDALLKRLVSIDPNDKEWQVDLWWN